MIHPYFSNSYAFLKALFVEQVKLQRSNAPTPFSAFQTLDVVVPDEAVRDELNRAIADVLGIASGVHFITTQSWLDRMNSGSPDITARARALEWAVYAVLTNDAFLLRPECVRLRNYIGSNTQTALWSLVCRIAALFSTYFSYRADWLWAWAGVELKNADLERTRREQKVLAAHPDFGWQRALWQELCTRTRSDGEKLWPDADAFLGIPQKWAERMQEQTTQLGDLYIFLPRELPPLALPQLLAESRRRSVHLFVENPSAAFWFDPSAAREGFAWFHRNASVRRALIDRLRNFLTQDTAQPESVVFLEDDLPESSGEEPAHRCVEPDALADMLKLKADSEDIEDIFIKPDPGTFLGALQNAVLEDDSGFMPQSVAADDDSFLIVRAPNAMREVQALCDWISSRMEASRGTAHPLEASDFLVVTPDIDAMAGVISAVMGSRSDEARLSYHIAGQSEFDINSAARALLEAMRFVGGAATAESFFELIEMPAFAAIRPQESFDASHIVTWLATAGYRWGLNEAHAREAVRRGDASGEGNAPFEGTLERALERLVAGNLVGDSKTLVAQDVFAIQGRELAGFDTTESDPQTFDFLLSLAQAFLDAGPMPQEQTLEGWLETTRRFADKLFGGYARSSEMSSFVMRAASLAVSAEEVIGKSQISFETWLAALEKIIRTNKTVTRATGRITFASTGDFAGISYKCVAVIGLNDGETFPGSSRREEFDLTAAKLVEDGRELNVARRGDRDARESNRGVFLDLLLAAREHFYVSYSIGSGSVAANPSVVLQDLKQAIAEGLEDPSEIDRLLTKTLPVLAAAAESFAPEMGALRSRSAPLAEAANKAAAAGYLDKEPAFADVPLSVREGATLSVADLAGFLIDQNGPTLKILGIARGSDQEVKPTPVLRLAEDNYLFRSQVFRSVREAMEGGMNKDDILTAAGFDPTLAERSVRTLVMQPVVNNYSTLYEEAEKEIGEVQGEDVVEGGRLLFEDLCGRPFDALAVPACRAVECEEGGCASLVVGASSNDLHRTFLLFAAVNVLADERGEEPVDFVYACVEKKLPVVRRWTVQRDNEEDSCRAVCELRILLEALLSVVNLHVGRFPVLAGGNYDEPPLVWRGLEGFRDAKTQTTDLLKKIAGMAGSYVKPGGKKRTRRKAKPAFEEFQEVMQAFGVDVPAARDAKEEP